MFDSIQKILIIKPSALGDIVHSLPFLRVVKKSFPGAQIDWVVAHGLHTFLEGHPMINHLWVIKKDQWKKMNRLGRTLSEITTLARDLKKQQYDLSIDLSGLLRSGLITWIAGAEYKLGFKESDEGSPFFYTHKIAGSMDIHAIDRYLEIARFMGCSIDKIGYPFAPYNKNPEIIKKLPKTFAVICPSAGKPANRWSAKKFGKLTAKLPCKSVVIASGAEADIAQQVVAHSKGKALSVAGQTSLKELIAVIEKARFFVCNDTGPMHIAAALNIPVFAIFGPANPIRTGPYGTRHTVIQQALDCSPCYAQKPCTRHDFKCMRTLSVEKVYAQIEKRGFLS